MRKPTLCLQSKNESIVISNNKLNSIVYKHFLYFYLLLNYFSFDLFISILSVI